MPKNENFIKKTECFIETGSYLGDGIQLAINSGFSKIYSIELGPHLHEICKKRFENQSNVNLILGDSAEKLKELLEENPNTPFTYWLDGHYSAGITVRGKKDCPLNEELEAILSRGVNGELIYIDDMRYYKKDKDITIEDILSIVKKYKPDATWRFEPSDLDAEDHLLIEY
jgi:hypothetical protein